MAKNKYLNGIVPMVLINFSIGSVYCWTLLKDDILAFTGFGTGVTEWAFSIAVFFLGMSAAFGGKLVEKDPNKSAFWTFITFTAGWFLTGFGVQTSSAALTLLGFGVVQGIGLGLGYITPVKTMMLWMGNRKGLAAGLSIAAFGLSGVIANPIIAFLLERVTVYQVFYVLATVYGVALLASAKLLHRPPLTEADLAADAAVGAKTFSTASVILSRKFVLLWVVFFLNITGGLALISQEKQIYNAVGIAATGLVVLFVSITATSNLVGRLSLASLQDNLSAKHLPYYAMTLISIGFTVLAAAFPTNTVATVALIVAIQFMFGVGFSCMPNILHQNWGISRLSTVHGLILSAWAAAGLVGNQVSSFFLAGPGLRALYVALAVLYTAQLVALVAWARTRRAGGDDDADARAGEPAGLPAELLTV